MRTTLQEDGQEITERVGTKKLVQGPTEGEWFEVDPQAIDQVLFEEEREDQRQEKTRQLILEAFAELKNNPEKYGRKFKTMMPKKDWHWKIVLEIRKLARELGDHNADWVEQALEWAQRIYNGESWKTICNDLDTANWYRLVVGKDGYTWFVGGSRLHGNIYPASEVRNNDYYANHVFTDTVPLVVDYVD